MGILAATFAALFLYFPAAIADCPYSAEPVTCQVFVGESCTLSFTIHNYQSTSLSLSSITWKTLTKGGTEIISYSGYSDRISTGDAYEEGRFALNKTNGFLTINDVSRESDDILFCFDGNTIKSSIYFCNCVKPVIQVVMTGIRLCRKQGGSSQCVSSVNKGAPVTLEVVKGSPITLTCSATACILPAPTYTWTVDTEVEISATDTSENDAQECSAHPGLLKSWSEIQFVPEWSYHGDTLSCAATNRNGSQYDVTASFRLDVHVRVEKENFYLTHKNGIQSKEGIISTEQDQPVEIECVVAESRPAAVLTWRLGNNDLFPSSKTSKYEYPNGLSTSEAMIKFQATKLLNLKRLYCMATTPDMLDPISTYVLLSVNGEGDSSLAIILGVLIPLSFIAIALIVAVIIKKRRKRRKVRRPREVHVSTICQPDRRPSLPLPMPSGAPEDTCGPPPVSERPFGICSYPDTAGGNSRYTVLPVTQPFPRKNLQILNEIGKGNFGVVYLAAASDILQTKSKTYVALKTLKENAGKDERRNLLREVDLMRRMESHPNIVRYLGCCLEAEPLYVIFEYLSNGNLQQYLRQNRSTDYTYIDALNDGICCADLIKFAWDIAKGMLHLSSNKWIHRDLAARNVLVSGDKVCKISDFGLADDVINFRTTQKKSDNAMPVRWMALESIEEDIFTTKSDVWSFGIVLWEIVTFGARPYPNTVVSGVINMLKKGFRMPKPGHCDEKLYDIMRSCWDVDAEQRPNFAQLVTSIEALLETEADYIAVGLYEESMYLSPNVSENDCHHETII